MNISRASFLLLCIIRIRELTDIIRNDSEGSGFQKKNLRNVSVHKIMKLTSRRFSRWVLVQSYIAENINIASISIFTIFRIFPMLVTRGMLISLVVAAGDGYFQKACVT